MPAFLRIIAPRAVAGVTLAWAAFQLPQCASGSRAATPEDGPVVDGHGTTLIDGPGRGPSALVQDGTRPGALAASAGTQEGPGKETFSFESSVSFGDLPMGRFVEAFKRMVRERELTAGGTEAAPSSKRNAQIIDLSRLSVVRIHSISTPTNWFEPYLPLSDSAAIGSGFAVEPEQGRQSKDDPVFMTNAHVVRDAHMVTVQLPAIGQMNFAAYVPLICDDFDLAIVRLFQPAEFVKAIAAKNASLHVLKVGNPKVSLGLDVEAVGFPLGSNSLKISRGVIAGTEEVYGATSYQSTAPISPGSSGGPLFSLEKAAQGELELIGVNFAASTGEGAQNVNYVIPIVHLHQMLGEFNRLMRVDAARRKAAAKALKQLVARAETNTNEETVGGDKSMTKRTDSAGLVSGEGYTHHTLHIAPINVVGVEGNDALYNSSGGCSSGFFISKIGSKSALLQAASPRVPEASFLTSVNGVPIDSFGMGRLNDFLSDPIPFESIMGMGLRMEELMNISICQRGQETRHSVSMVWQPQYELGIKAIAEPHYMPDVLDYEIFAGVTLMQMSVNHVTALVQAGSSTLGRWLLPECQQTPRLLVTDVRKGSYASRNLVPGMVIQNVNGKPIYTLADYRKYFEPGGSNFWTLQTSRGLVLKTNFMKELVEQLTVAVHSPTERYMLTPAVKLAAMHHLVPRQKQQQPGPEQASVLVYLNSTVVDLTSSASGMVAAQLQSPVQAMVGSSVVATAASDIMAVAVAGGALSAGVTSRGTWGVRKGPGMDSQALASLLTAASGGLSPASTAAADTGSFAAQVAPAARAAGSFLRPLRGLL